MSTEIDELTETAKDKATEAKEKVIIAQKAAVSAVKEIEKITTNLIEATGVTPQTQTDGGEFIILSEKVENLTVHFGLCGEKRWMMAITDCANQSNKMMRK